MLSRKIPIALGSLLTLTLVTAFATQESVDVKPDIGVAYLQSYATAQHGQLSAIAVAAPARSMRGLVYPADITPATRTGSSNLPAPVASLPEPGTYALMLFGICILLFTGRKPVGMGPVAQDVRAPAQQATPANPAPTSTSSQATP